jgi:hypothetical protein
LKARLSVIFGQIVAMMASDRAGYSGLWEYFNESLHQTKDIPAHYTAGMVNIVASASMKAFMHDVMAIEGEANGKFGSSLVNNAVAVDAISSNAVMDKKPFESKFELDATVGFQIPCQ